MSIERALFSKFIKDTENKDIKIGISCRPFFLGCLEYLVKEIINVSVENMNEDDDKITEKEFVLDNEESKKNNQ